MKVDLSPRQVRLLMEMVSDELLDSERVLIATRILAAETARAQRKAIVWLCSRVSIAEILDSPHRAIIERAYVAEDTERREAGDV